MNTKSKFKYFLHVRYACRNNYVRFMGSNDINELLEETKKLNQSNLRHWYIKNDYDVVVASSEKK